MYHHTFAFWFKHSAGGSSEVSKSPLAISSSSLTSSVRVSSRQTSRPPIFLALSKIFPFSSCKQHRHTLVRADCLHADNHLQVQ